MAKKFGMAAASKAPEKKRTDHSLSMMLHRQAQVAKAKAAGAAVAPAHTANAAAPAPETNAELLGPEANDIIAAYTDV